MAKKVGIADIAKEVGLSKTTVSFVLNRKHREVKIAPETAARVLKTAQQLGYRSNYWAKSLVNRKTHLVGVMYPDLTGSSAHEVTKGIQQVLDIHGYDSLLAVYYWDRDKERRELEMMLEKRVEALIALPYALSAEAYKEVLAEGCPVVFMCDYLMKVEGASSVALDPVDSVEKCVYHLHKLGHRNIAFMTVQYEAETLLGREEAFKRSLQQLDLPYHDGSIVRTMLADVSSVAQSVREFMTRKNRPTALVTISDALGLQTLTELGKLKVRVPKELAVASIGNMGFTDNPFFSLTTVDECREEVGRQAAKLVMRYLDTKDGTKIDPEHIRIKGPLIERRSTLGDAYVEEDEGIREVAEEVLKKQS
ncbi:MAG: LacI family DNA-binding transcriptional regulator [Sedimentisphaerales bacterium]|nr:LacI family DNA-binding transcriptional regulator [Sedimentisphaerales bacterium]